MSIFINFLFHVIDISCPDDIDLDNYHIYFESKREILYSNNPHYVNGSLICQGNEGQNKDWWQRFYVSQSSFTVREQCEY